MHTIIEMANNDASEGMPIDLSSLSPKCDHYMIGKQMHLKKLRGVKEGAWLEARQHKTDTINKRLAGGT